MARPSWLVDSSRIAKKIKSASAKCDPNKVNWKSNPSRACPKCNHIIDNSDVTQEWPGLPCGVKFDPSDQEIIFHLLAKVGNGNLKAHPFIEEFIPTVHEEDGICYTHPQNLPGVKQDGSVSHFFHTAIKAYNTGNRKRRKINGAELGDVRWHKTGRTKPVILDGIQMGCKKIMVLYMSTAKSGKPEKTNWVMHQYHLGIEEDEKDGEFVISKIFYQQQAKPGDKVEENLSSDITEAIITKVDPVTPKSVNPEPRHTERWQSDVNPGQEHEFCVNETPAQVNNLVVRNSYEMLTEVVVGEHNNHKKEEVVVGNNHRKDEENQMQMVNDHYDIVGDHNNHTKDEENQMVGDPYDIVEDPKLWAGESQFPFDSEQFGSQFLTSQQLLDGLSLVDEFTVSQPENGEGGGEERKNSRLSDYAHLGVEVLKKDLEECQNFCHLEFPISGKRMLKPGVSDYVQGSVDPKQDLEESQNTIQLDPSNIILDTPPDYRLSQLEFNDSDDSFFTWTGKKLSD